MTGSSERRSSVAAGGRAVLLAAIALGLTPAAMTPGAGISASAGPDAGVTGRPADVEIQTSLDRDALWVADRFVYTIQLTCRRGTDILADDLSADKLHLDGPEIVGVEPMREDRGNGVTVHRVRYHLTTYRVDPAVQRIGDSSVRYYVRRPGQRIDDAVPAGEVLVPGRRVVVRSLLPDDREAAVFRDARLPVPPPARYAVVQPVGIGLLVLSIGPAVVWAAVTVGRRPARRHRRSGRHARGEQRASLESLRAIDPSVEEQRRAAYDLIVALMRRHLRESCSLQADALTADELGARLPGFGYDAETVDLAVTVLAACDRARYGGPAVFGSAEDCRASIDQAARFLSARPALAQRQPARQP